ncbi:MAG: DUF5615 family PIN-like protein [Bacteroidales bacterium]|nr:DUF5615 family PIN-like protein [Bacteroidales bacterium]
MKLLFNQNIYFRLLSKIIDILPDSCQVKQLELENASDLQIWKYINKKHYCSI